MMYLTHLILPHMRESVPLFSKLMANSYLEHQVLWSMLKASPEATRDFLYRSDKTSNGLELYVLAPQPFAPGSPWVAKSRPYNPVLRKGQVVAFNLRVAPTEDRAQGPAKRSKREDMVMARYIAADQEVSVDQICQGVAVDWLQRREQSSGFRLIEASASNYTRIVPFKNGKPMGKVPLLDIKGLLEVTDPDAFLQRQRIGFGKSKFVGGGLMLLTSAR